MITDTSYNPGNKKTQSNFQVLSKKPLDSRMITSHRSNFTSYTYKYDGMLSYDLTSQGLYVYKYNDGTWLDICLGGLQQAESQDFEVINPSYELIQSHITQFNLLSGDIYDLSENIHDLSKNIYDLSNSIYTTITLFSTEWDTYVDISNDIIDISHRSLRLDTSINALDISLTDFFDTNPPAYVQTIYDVTRDDNRMDHIRPDAYTKIPHRLGTIPSGTNIADLLNYNGTTLLSKIFYGEEYPIIINPTVRIKNATEDNILYYVSNEDPNDTLRIIAELNKGSIGIESESGIEIQKSSIIDIDFSGIYAKIITYKDDDTTNYYDMSLDPISNNIYSNLAFYYDIPKNELTEVKRIALDMKIPPPTNLLTDLRTTYQYLHTQGSYGLFENHPDKEWIILNMFSNANIDVTSIQSSEIINKIVNQDISFNLTTTVELVERTPFLYKGAIIDDIRRAEARIDLEETLEFLVN